MHVADDADLPYRCEHCKEEFFLPDDCIAHEAVCEHGLGFIEEDEYE